MNAVDEEARRLRETVYGPCSDKSWDAVSENWSRPDALQWLRDKAAHPLPERPCTCAKKK